MDSPEDVKAIRALLADIFELLANRVAMHPAIASTSCFLWRSRGEVSTRLYLQHNKSKTTLTLGDFQLSLQLAFLLLLLCQQSLQSLVLRKNGSDLGLQKLQ